jgi:DNA modification methylase
METNKIYQGDCLELMKQIEDESIDCIITDPPYGINKGKIAGDEDFSLINKFLPEAFRVLKDNSFFICFCSIAKLPELLKNNIFNYRWMCIYYINNGMVRGSMGFSAFIPAIIFTKGNPKIKKQIRDVCEISTSSKEVKSFYHPYQKDFRIIRDLILCSTKEGELVLDPFMGGGSVPNACINLKRNFIGMELSEEYCKIANERLTKLNDGNDGIPPKPKDLGILPTII